MNRIIISMTAAGLLFYAAQAIAVESMTQPTMNKRHTIRDCMTKQMTANKTMSYNGATKVCTDRMKTQPENSASSTPLKQ
jgi:hypothetical protein